MIRIFYFLSLLFASSSAVSHDYCIVGAGPGGLQLAYFLKHSKSDYVVFERHSGPGAFFEVCSCFQNLQSFIACCLWLRTHTEVSHSPQANQHQQTIHAFAKPRIQPAPRLVCISVVFPLFSVFRLFCLALSSLSVSVCVFLSI